MFASTAGKRGRESRVLSSPESGPRGTGKVETLTQERGSGTGPRAQAARRLSLGDTSTVPHYAALRGL